MDPKDFIDLNKFIKMGKIGKGSFSSVYKIVDKETNKIYAAKIVDNPITENQFRNYQIVSKLNHPAIIKYIGYSPVNFSQKPKPTIITEYFQNGELSIWLDLKRHEVPSQIPLDNTKKLIIIYGIASGMSYMHSNNVLHLDLKPANILLDDHLFPIITGFSLARYSTDNIERKLMGTLIYISPEVLKDCEYTVKNDVYAFSLVLYEIITGEEPFVGDNQYKIMISVLQGIRPTIPDSVTDQCINLITRCWSEDPDERPTFEEIATMLKNDPKSFINGDFDEKSFL